MIGNRLEIDTIQSRPKLFENVGGCVICNQSLRPSTTCSIVCLALDNFIRKLPIDSFVWNGLIGFFFFFFFPRKALPLILMVFVAFLPLPGCVRRRETPGYSPIREARSPHWHWKDCTCSMIVQPCDHNLLSDFGKAWLKELRR